MSTATNDVRIKQEEVDDLQRLTDTVRALSVSDGDPEDTNVNEAEAAEVQALLEIDPHLDETLPVSCAPRPNVFHRLQAICCAAVVLPYTILRAALRPLLFVSIACLFFWAAIAQTSCYIAPGRSTILARARPVCALPFKAFGCLCTPHTNDTQPQVDLRTLMKLQGDSLVALLEHYNYISTAIHDMTATDVAVPGLIRVIGASGFTSKDLLSLELEELQGDAFRAREGLEKLGRRMHYCADSTIGINDFALRTLANHRQTPLERLFGSSDANLCPVARESFELSLEGFASCIDGLAVLGEDVVIHLNSFGLHLDAIQDIISREGDAALVGKKELLRRLQTLFGGNHYGIRIFEDNLLVVSLISNIHSKATLHVNAVISSLGGINYKIAVLRSSTANVDKPYGASTSPPLKDQLYYVQVEMARVLEKMGDVKEKRTEAQTSALERAGVAE